MLYLSIFIIIIIIIIIIIVILFTAVFEKDDYSYKIVLAGDDSRTWYEAEEICREYEGGHLASITDEAENSFLNEKIQLLSNSPSKPEQLWTGAKDDQQSGKAYQWADGHKFQ